MANSMFSRCTQEMLVVVVHLQDGGWKQNAAFDNYNHYAVKSVQNHKNRKNSKYRQLIKKDFTCFVNHED